jgi:hypothetical protein
MLAVDNSELDVSRPFDRYLCLGSLLESESEGYSPSPSLCGASFLFSLLPCLTLRHSFNRVSPSLSLSTSLDPCVWPWAA